MDIKKILSSTTALVKSVADNIAQDFRRAPSRYAMQKGRYVLSKVSTDGKRAMYRHPTKKGPGRTIIVKM